jgi:hypothetical protein
MGRQSPVSLSIIATVAMLSRDATAGGLDRRPGMKAAIPSGKRYRYGKRRPGAGRVMKHLVAGEPPAQNRRAFGGHAGVAGADWTSGASADDGHRAIRSPKLSRSRGVSANGAGLGRLGLGNACFPASVTFRPTCAAMLS